MEYRKKPVSIEAFHVGVDDIPQWFAEAVNDETVTLSDDLKSGVIHTLEGEEKFDVETDWIIKGVKGEIYPCKDDVFTATYEPIASGRCAIGEIVGEGKDAHLEGTTENVGWVLNKNLAVTIRDLIRDFDKHTPCVGRYVFRKNPQLSIIEGAIEWSKILNDLANKLDYIAKYDDIETGGNERVKYRATLRTAFETLIEVFDDLWF